MYTYIHVDFNASFLKAFRKAVRKSIRKAIRKTIRYAIRKAIRKALRPPRRHSQCLRVAAPDASGRLNEFSSRMVSSCGPQHIQNIQTKQNI